MAAATGSKSAAGAEKCSRIVNVFTQSVEEGDIAIKEGRIVGSEPMTDELHAGVGVHMGLARMGPRR